MSLCVTLCELVCVCVCVFLCVSLRVCVCVTRGSLPLEPRGRRRASTGVVAAPMAVGAGDDEGRCPPTPVVAPLRVDRGML